jgi:DNA gyrase/topoisomerase IV subunit A
MPLKNIPKLSRNTKGVSLMRLKNKEDKVSTLTILEKIEIEPETKK